MKVVSRFEANLLTLLRFFLGREAAVRADGLLRESFKAPKCLGPDALSLVRDALAKGTTLLLARLGGWRRARHLRGDAVVDGRLWQRTPPADLGLTFGPATLRFLVWATACDARTAKDDIWEWETITLGDTVFLFFAYAALRDAGLHRDLGLPAQPTFVRHGLCRLAYPEDFAAAAAAPDFAAWTAGVGGCVLEALQPLLHGRWRDLERSKEHQTYSGAMRSLGESQERVLDAFLTAVESAGRFDLARFLLETAADLLPEGAHARDWVGALEPVPGQRLADRNATHRAATAFLRCLDRLKAWERRARATGYFDEGYAAAQLALADWEQHAGDLRYARAQAILKHLDPLKAREATS